jgi:hypothetical protein
MLPFNSCAKELVDLSLFLQICAHGISTATKAQDAVRLNARIKRALGEPAEDPEPEDLERAAEFERVATEHQNLGFTFLFGLGVIKLWSLAETTVDSIVASRLVDPCCWGDHDQLKILEGPLVDFARLSPSEQASFLAHSLREAVKAKFQKGVGRFEAVLNPVGLGGSIDKDVKRLILELQQVRHICVHNAGCADGQFLKECPWIDLQPGNKVLLTEDRFYSYALALKWYLVEIAQRMLSPEQTQAADRHEKSKRGVHELLCECIERCSKLPVSADTLQITSGVPQGRNGST